jgi:cupin 2 domain-containing protein
MIPTGNLFSDSGPRLAQEQTTEILSTADLRIERIVSFGQASPPGFWYDQDRPEWVVLLAGAASLRFADEDSSRELKPGDYVHIPAHVRHRVEWTDASALWLAIHHR